MTDLKLCPFCGDTYAVIYTTLEDGYCAECLECHAKTDWFSTKAEAIAAWNRRADGWIPVTERLPEENRLVQVYNGSVTCGILREPQIIGGGWMIAFDYSGVLEFQFPVTHWMPLPQPPEVK